MVAHEVTDYSEANALLRGLHLERHPTRMARAAPSAGLPPVGLLGRAPRKKYVPPSQRSSAQPAGAAPQQPSDAPHDSLFRKFQQQGIREYRESYNQRVTEHVGLLQAPGASAAPVERSRARAPLAGDASAAARLGGEQAGRHLRPITQYVAACAGPSAPTKSASHQAAQGRGRTTGGGGGVSSTTRAMPATTPSSARATGSGPAGAAAHRAANPAPASRCRAPGRRGASSK